MAGKDRAVAASLTTKLQGKRKPVPARRAKAALHRNMAEPGSGR